MIHASSEGDLGAWFLALHKPPSVHLVAEGLWSFHEDTVWRGNLEITEEQWGRFCDGMTLR